MSLINDALKRAREAQQKNNPAGTPPMRPAEARRAEWDLGRILPLIIIFLIIAALFFIGLAMVWRSGKAVVAAPETTTNQLAEFSKSAAASAASADPAAVATPAPKTNRLQGIAYDPDHPWAIISGKTVIVGDLADGQLVMSISSNAVTLVGRGQTNTLTLGH